MALGNIAAGYTQGVKLESNWLVDYYSLVEYFSVNIVMEMQLKMEFDHEFVCFGSTRSLKTGSLH